jgi:RNA polymerase sigma factor (sigma-70 family)
MVPPMTDFPQTQWSQILALQANRDGANNATRHRELLEALLQRYWPAVYHYVRALSRGSAAEAEDTTQQFFTAFIERDDLQKLSANRGTFRGFLKTAVKHFFISQIRSEASRKRTLTFAAAEQSFRRAPIDDPERAFDREWVRLVLDEAIALLRNEMQHRGDEQGFAIFEAYCLSDDAEVSYQELAQRFNQSLDAVRNGLRSTRQRLRKILREKLREYVGPDGDLEQELRFVVEGL